MNAFKHGIAALALAAAAPLAMASTTTSFGFACLTDNTGTCASFADQLQMDVTDVGGGKVEFKFMNLNPTVGSITQIYFDTNLGNDVRLSGAAILAQPATGQFQIVAATGFPPGSNGNPWNWGGTTDFRFDPRSQGGVVNNGVQSGEFLTLGFNLLVPYASLIDSFTNPPLGATRIGLHLQSLTGGQSEGMYAIREIAVVPVPAALPLMLTGLLGFGLLGRRRRNAA